jgi:hypothetical protein
MISRARRVNFNGHDDCVSIVCDARTRALGENEQCTLGLTRRVTCVGLGRDSRLVIKLNYRSLSEMSNTTHHVQSSASLLHLHLKIQPFYAIIFDRQRSKKINNTWKQKYEHFVQKAPEK